VSFQGAHRVYKFPEIKMFQIAILKTTMLKAPITALFLFSTQIHAQSFAHNYSPEYSDEDDVVSDIIQKKQKKQNNAASPKDILLSIEKTPVDEVDEQLRYFDTLFTGSAELGFLYKTGNSQTGDIKAAFDFRAEQGQWLSSLNMDLLVKKADITDELTGDTHFGTTEEKWGIVSQTNYTLSDSNNHYIYGNISLEDKSTSSYSRQRSISSGWGKHWYRSANASFWADIGPGYKSDVLRETDLEPSRTEDTWIIQAQALYLRKLGEFVEFKQFLSTKYALSHGNNSILKAESSITTKLISTLQLRFTFTVDYNSEIEIDKKHTDTQTAVTLVYSF
jgi:putative salt-induced outer membrane protein YdiY